MHAIAKSVWHAYRQRIDGEKIKSKRFSMTIRHTITEDLKAAMKRGDHAMRDTLRVVDSMIKNEEIAQKKRDAGLDDAATIAVLKRALKQRHDSVAQYRAGKREDLAQKEEAEIAVIEKYVPAQMAQAQLEEIVQRVIAETGATSRADMGKVMAAAMREIGDAADGMRVRTAVERFLV